LTVSGGICSKGERGATKTMSIGIDTQCLQCYLRRQVETARTLGDEATATRFAQELMAHLSKIPEHQTTVSIAPKTAEMFHRYYGLDTDRYKEEKRQSNQFFLEREHWFRALADGAGDPVLAGLQMAILGNYLDFSALQGQIRFDKLEEMCRDALKTALDGEALERLKADLAKAKTLLYITDNAGEIGFDKLCAEKLKEAYPDLQITFCVRGGPALNDATREDAEVVGIPFPVIDNGNNIPGTDLELMDPGARVALEQADVVIAKGMANVETLYGCGYNIYYAFLVKCPRFVGLFNKPLMSPMLIPERK